jgi:hypothetical protein
MADLNDFLVDDLFVGWEGDTLKDSCNISNFDHSQMLQDPFQAMADDSHASTGFFDQLRQLSFQLDDDPTQRDLVTVEANEILVSGEPTHSAHVIDSGMGKIDDSDTAQVSLVSVLGVMDPELLSDMQIYATQEQLCRGQGSQIFLTDKVEPLWNQAALQQHSDWPSEHLENDREAEYYCREDHESFREKEDECHENQANYSEGEDEYQEDGFNEDQWESLAPISRQKIADDIIDRLTICSTTPVWFRRRSAEESTYYIGTRLISM